MAPSRIVRLERLANGRFTRPLHDTATCPASSHEGGGIRWIPATAALAAATLLGYGVGVVGSPDPSDAAVMATPSPSISALPTPSIVYVPASPAPSAVLPGPTASPSFAPVATPFPYQQPVIIIQLPPQSVGQAGGGSTTRQVIEHQTIIRETVTVPGPTQIPGCVDPGLHLGRACKRAR